LPIMGIGGIATVDDALEFLVAGASAVQVGTATFYDPTAADRLVDDLASRLTEIGVNNVSAMIGTLRSNRDSVVAPAPKA
jgi:dihydroorotate dehydrogenase (NAD+) catalytic subunit